MASSGEFLLDNLVPYDTAFHVGLTRELTLGYPPQVPGVSGFRLGYHLGPDLVRAAALRWAAVDPYDSINRFDVTLGAIALILALRAMTRAAGGGPFAVDLAGLHPPGRRFLVPVRGQPPGALVGGPAARQPAGLAGPLQPGDPGPRAGAWARWSPSSAIKAAAAAGSWLAALPGGRGPLLQGVPRRPPAPRPRRGRRPRAGVALRRRAGGGPALRAGHGAPRPRARAAARSTSRWRRSTSSAITRESLELPPLSGVALAGWAVAVAGRFPGPARCSASARPGGRCAAARGPPPRWR